MVLLLVAFAAFAPAVRAQEDPIEPAGVEPSEAELAFYEQRIVCPPLADAESVFLNVRSFPPFQSVSLTCRYLTEQDQEAARFQLFWFKSDAPSEVCRSQPGASREGDRSTISPDPLTFDAIVLVQFQPGAYDDFDAVEAAAIRLLQIVEPFARLCRSLPEPAVALTCPIVDGLEAPRYISPTADTTSFDAYFARGSYGEDSAPGLFVTARWLVENHDITRLETLCQEPENTIAGEGLVKQEGRAAIVRYSIDSSVPVDRAPYEAAARNVATQVAGQALDCGGIATISYDDFFTPLPAYLVDAFAPEIITAAAPAPADDQASVTAAAATTSFPGGEASTGTPPGTAAGGGGSGLWRSVSALALVFSVAMVAFTLYMSRKEARVRPRMDIARIAIKIGAVLGMLLLTTREAPLPAVIAALVLGAALGYWQGANLAIRSGDKGLYAKRGFYAILVFGAGVLIVQAAGILRRSGVVNVGLALSFLSIATAVALLVGRRPRIAAARATGTASLIWALAGSLVLLFVGFGGADAQSRQIEPEDRTPTMEAAIDLVDWERVQISGGIYAGLSKPWTELAVPRALDEAPEALTRTVNWPFESGGSSATTFAVTETFTFGLRDDGLCCTVTYEGTGRRTIAVFNGDPLIEDIEAAGRLADLQSVAVSGPGAGGSPSEGQPGFPFTEVRNYRTEAGDTCWRIVGESASVEGQIDSYLVDGEPRDAPFDFLYVALGVECEVTGFSIPAVLRLLPPPPPRGDASRAQDPQNPDCPVIQEWARALDGSTSFEGASTLLASQLTVAPNAPGCTYGSRNDPVSFGDSSPGGTRHEAAWQLAQPSEGEWDPGFDRWFTYDRMFDLRRPSAIPPDGRCAVAIGGAAADPGPDSTCESITMHRVGEGQIHIYTDWDRSDGPNTSVWVNMPWGTFTYRCHHCTPGSPDIASFLIEFNGFATTFINDVEVAGPLPTAEEEAEAAAARLRADREAEARATADLADLFVDDDATEQDRNAALAAVLGLLGISGIAAIALAESGMSAVEVATAFARGGRAAVDELFASTKADLIRDAVVDEYGHSLVPDEEGLYRWDDGQEVRRVTRQELEELIGQQMDAISASKARHEAILAVQTGDQAATDRFGNMLERTMAENDALMAEIRAGWDTVDDLQRLLDARAEALLNLEVAEAQKAYADALNTWTRLMAETYAGSAADLQGLPTEIVDATRFVVQAAANVENWRIVAETAGMTVYDVSGQLMGGLWGDTDESFADAVAFGGRAASAIAEMMWHDPVGTMVMLSPLQDFADSVDPDRTLGERLGSLGIGFLDVGGSLFGGGARVASTAGEFAEAARLGGAAADTDRMADRILDLADAQKVAERRINWDLNIEKGRERVDDFLWKVEEGSGPDELRDAVLGIQSNKQALLTMKGQPEHVRRAFVEELRKVYDQTDTHVLREVALNRGFDAPTLRLSDDLTEAAGANIRVFIDDAGNQIHLFEPTNAIDPWAVGADRDFAVKYLTRVDADAGATAQYIKYDQSAEWYRAGFWKAAGGEQAAHNLGIPTDNIAEAQKALLRRLDQAITDNVHPEAYTDVDRVIGRPDLGLSDPQQVGMTVAYKADEWWLKASKIADPAVREDFLSEGARQLVKQFDTQITGRHAALAKEIEAMRAIGGDIPPLKPMPKQLVDAMEVMRRVQEDGMAPVDMERALLAMGTTPAQVAASMASYLETMEKLSPSALDAIRRI